MPSKPKKENCPYDLRMRISFDVVEGPKRITRFEFDKASVDGAGKAVLDAAMNAISSCPKARLNVTGYTDSTGSATYNQNLSERRKERQAAKEARGDCQIKGDITPEGERLYRRPGEPDYEWAWISEAKGERWFCSVDEAEAAGWRAAE